MPAPIPALGKAALGRLIGISLEPVGSLGSLGSPCGAADLACRGPLPNPEVSQLQTLLSIQTIRRRGPISAMTACGTPARRRG
jgi:hypothetical protein